MNDEWTRSDLFRYLTAAESGDYIAIMGLFTDTLMTDLSAVETAAALHRAGREISTDTAEQRCRQLLNWGNLTSSVRDARVSTVAEYLRSRSRYQVSKLGGQVHRSAVDILHAAEGAREVARELLGQIAEALDRVLAALAEELPDAEHLAGEATTIFSNQRLFTDSVRDFYAYLAGVLSRYDLGGSEYAHFKTLLLDYVDLITADVNRHAPAVAVKIEAVLQQLERLLELLATVRGLTLPDGTPVERSHGRSGTDWTELAAWYGTVDGNSGAQQLRAAAGQALGQLITNAKRLLDASGTGFSRRADLLRLARWFAESDGDTADRLFAAAFVAYPTRHLLLGPAEPDPRIGPTTSWWQSAPVEVPVSLRDRGDRSIRGRSSRVPDPSADRRRLAEIAQQETRTRQAAAAELVAVGALHGSKISPAARDLLLEMLSQLLGRHQDEYADRDLNCVLRAAPCGDTVVHSEDGTTWVEGLLLHTASMTASETDIAS